MSRGPQALPKLALCAFFSFILTSSLSIRKCREWMFAWNQQRRWDETRHFCTFCSVLSDFYKSLLTELAFCSSVQNHNASVFSFRGKSSTVLPIIWLSATQLQPIKSHSRLSLATSKEWNRTLSSKYTALAAADFKSTAAQHGQHLRISTSCGVDFRHTQNNFGGEDETSQVHGVVFLSFLIACSLRGGLSGGKQRWDAVRAAVCSCHCVGCEW